MRELKNNMPNFIKRTLPFELDFFVLLKHY